MTGLDPALPVKGTVMLLGTTLYAVATKVKESLATTPSEMLSTTLLQQLPSTPSRRAATSSPATIGDLLMCTSLDGKLGKMRLWTSRW